MLRCRYCLEDDNLSALLAPCACKGTMQYVHEACLVNWLTCGGKSRCEVCKCKFEPPPSIKRKNRKRCVVQSVLTILCLLLFMLMFKPWDPIPMPEYSWWSKPVVQLFILYTWISTSVRVSFVLMSLLQRLVDI